MRIGNEVELNWQFSEKGNEMVPNCWKLIYSSTVNLTETFQFLFLHDVKWPIEQFQVKKMPNEIDHFPMFPGKLVSKIKLSVAHFCYPVTRLLRFDPCV